MYKYKVLVVWNVSSLVPAFFRTVTVAFLCYAVPNNIVKY